MWRCSEDAAAFEVGNTFLRWLSCVHPLVVIGCPWARLTSPPTITAITPAATTIARIGANVAGHGRTSQSVFKLSFRGHFRTLAQPTVRYEKARPGVTLGACAGV